MVETQKSKVLQYSVKVVATENLENSLNTYSKDGYAVVSIAPYVLPGNMGSNNYLVVICK